MASKARTRRHRRTGKQVMQYGLSAKRRHTHPSGRTGRIFSRQLQEPKRVKQSP